MSDPIDVPEPEPDLEPHSDNFFSMGVVLRNLPYLAVLALAIFGSPTAISPATRSTAIGNSGDRHRAFVHLPAMAERAGA